MRHAKPCLADVPVMEGVQMDKLTPEQELYLASWSEGT